ncbi:urease accessory protein UreE [Trinickia mobilis]|uniref:urease accessory protein UreE n=1 Tax=Trinickia mobilis TaxID=2816356 RepID=UPI001A8C011F|nr:urease accessory protein UreE [Trinickia mobilis]
MLKIERYLAAPHGIAAVLVERAPRLVLPFAERSKSRLRAALEDGREVGVFLPRGTVLRDGDLLVAEDGSLIAVCAAAESVLEVSAGDSRALIRAAYHLGNRHQSIEIGDDYLRLQYDPVLEDMLARLGVTVTRAERVFEPEVGAYGGGHKHGHDETFAEDYALAQGVFEEHHGHDRDHEHLHGHAHGHDHAHDANCGHEH